MLKPIRPAAPIRARYEARLTAMIDDMHASILHWITAAWNKADPETTLYGQDEAPVKVLKSMMSQLGRQWSDRFDELADSLADYFSKAVLARNDRALAEMLRKGGFSVRFKMTKAMRQSYDAVRAENVGLIRSIAAQHLGQVDTLVMQSVSQGRDLATLTKALHRQLGVTKRRAAFIALDQNNKATAVLQKSRHIELGITKAKWLHSAGGKTPRPEHKAFSGKVYDIREGHDFGDGNGPVWPGTAINCRCVSVPIVPGFDD
ncbi:MAG: hypothetical protein KGM49_00535 [Sphingomonadales bacterium]|nr:hypothetical protein [Sphingomonadales bacterium]